mmetsp:Transcript_8535/g.15510  ORF Transcript_8535/g.15510 Transcript_8535/m.15510 type:complete len:212 (-) Transcript_8535:451-1086(-)
MITPRNLVAHHVASVVSVLRGRRRDAAVCDGGHSCFAVHFVRRAAIEVGVYPLAVRFGVEHVRAAEEHTAVIWNGPIRVSVQTEHWDELGNMIGNGVVEVARVGRVGRRFGGLNELRRGRRNSMKANSIRGQLVGQRGAIRVAVGKERPIPREIFFQEVVHDGQNECDIVDFRYSATLAPSVPLVVNALGVDADEIVGAVVNVGTNAVDPH